MVMLSQAGSLLLLLGLLALSEGVSIFVDKQFNTVATTLATTLLNLASA